MKHEKPPYEFVLICRYNSERERERESFLPHIRVYVYSYTIYLLARRVSPTMERDRVVYKERAREREQPPSLMFRTKVRTLVHTKCVLYIW